MISLIVAVAENNIIGATNHPGLLWHIPSELAYFRRMSAHHTLVMGRKTWDSLPTKPLKGRPNIILSRNLDPISLPQVRVTSQLEDVLALPEDIMIIGGAQIYALFLPFCQRIFLTRVHKCVKGDIFFPELPDAEWELNDATESPIQKEGDEAAYTICILSRRS